MYANYQFAVEVSSIRSMNALTEAIEEAISRFSPTDTSVSPKIED